MGHAAASHRQCTAEHLCSRSNLRPLRLGPDGHTLYFTSNHIVPPEYPKTLRSSTVGLKQMHSWNDGNDNIWWIDLAPWIDLYVHPNR